MPPRSVQQSRCQVILKLLIYIHSRDKSRYQPAWYLHARFRSSNIRLYRLVWHVWSCFWSWRVWCLLGRKSQPWVSFRASMNVGWVYASWYSDSAWIWWLASLVQPGETDRLVTVIKTNPDWKQRSVLVSWQLSSPCILCNILCSIHYLSIPGFVLSMRWKPISRLVTDLPICPPDLVITLLQICRARILRSAYCP